VYLLLLLISDESVLLVPILHQLFDGLWSIHQKPFLNLHDLKHVAGGIHHPLGAVLLLSYAHLQAGGFGLLEEVVEEQHEADEVLIGDQLRQELWRHVQLSNISFVLHFKVAVILDVISDQLNDILMDQSCSPVRQKLVLQIMSAMRRGMETAW
jgi:hypothetical protein